MNNRVALFAICYLATASAGIAASMFSAFLPTIVHELTHQTSREVEAGVGSIAGAAFLFGWTVGAIVIGAMSDRIGRKMALFMSVLVCTLGIVATSFAESVLTLAVIRFVSGAGAGSILLISAILVAEKWATGGRARMTGIIANSFPVGLIVSGTIATLVPDWRLAYLIGGSTVVLALAVLIIVPESEWWVASADDHRQRELAREKVLDPAYRRDLVVGTTLFGAMLVGLWAVFVWMPTYVGTLGDPLQAQSNRSLTTIMLGLGSVAGGFLSGPFAERFGRKGAVRIGYMGCALLTAIIFIPTHTPGIPLLLMTFSLSVFIGLNQGVLVGYVPELFPTLIRGVATGICFNTGRLITSVTVILAGVLITTLGGYRSAILLFGAAYLVGLLFTSRARETRGAQLPM